MVKRLGDDAIGAGMNNVAFLTRFLSGDLNACLEILLKSNRIPEAAFFARTYLPSQISRVVQLWKVSLGQVNAKAAQSLADPQQVRKKKHHFICLFIYLFISSICMFVSLLFVCLFLKMIHTILLDYDLLHYNFLISIVLWSLTFRDLAELFRYLCSI